MKNAIRKVTPNFLLRWYHKVLAVLASVVYRFPSHRLIVIGVTGTNGKTTTCHMIADMLESSGVVTGLLSTIEFRIAKKRWVNATKQGMQGRFQLQKLLRQMVKAGCKAVVIEVTSEGIAQYRHWGIEFSVGVLTNLTPEHIESHGSFQNYKHAKSELFKNVRQKRRAEFADIVPTTITNIDSPHSDFFVGIPSRRKWCYGVEGGHHFTDANSCDKLFEANDINLHLNQTECIIDGMDVTIHLPGRMNVYNALAAWCVGEVLDISKEKRALAFKNITTVPGRMEKIEKHGITVIVDYAHDAAALENVYETLIDMKASESKLIGVLGATGGGRDKEKRPILGKLAAHYCDAFVLTNDDPYDEPPMEIIHQIEKGVIDKGTKVKNETYWLIEDRREAITKALSIARPGDMVVITGKGAEEVIVLADGKHPWNDKQEVERILSKM